MQVHVTRDDHIAAHSGIGRVCGRARTRSTKALSHRTLRLSSRAGLFSGPMESWLYRSRTYAHLGLMQHLVHPMYPPRRITIVDRVGLNGR